MGNLSKLATVLIATCVAIVAYATPQDCPKLQDCPKANADNTYCVQQNKGKHNSGPKGFNTTRLTTISDLKKTAKDDEIVRLEGSLVEQLKHDKYLFKDTNGDTIKLELDDDRDWSFIEKDMPLEIVAKVDKELMSFELELINARPK